MMVRRASICLFGLLLLYGSICQAAPLYTINEQVFLAVPEYSFNDLLEEAGVWTDTLAAMHLGRAPRAGQTHFYSREYLQFLLTRQGVPAELFNIPPRVEVTTLLRSYPPAELEQALVELLVAEDPALMVSLPRNPPQLNLPEGPVEFILTEGRLRIPGTNTVLLDVFIAGYLWEQVRVTVFLDREVQVLTAARELKRGQDLDQTDFKEVSFPASSVPARAIYSGEEFIPTQYKLRTNLNSGSIVTWYQLEMKPLIERGELVTIKLSSNGFEIYTEGEALERGILGAEIRVRLTGNNHVIKARVVESGLLIVSK